jgi:hypothetical protein
VLGGGALSGEQEAADGGDWRERRRPAGERKWRPAGERKQRLGRARERRRAQGKEAAREREMTRETNERRKK